jgi:hypothetical protein
MARRGFLVLAVIAALLGAPQVAFAAANALGSPSATPATGSTETVFVLRVEYDGQFPATGVTAVVGTRTLPMSLVAGSPTSGTWSAATTLPAGTWPVRYSALVLQGNAPSLSGPTLTVYPAAGPPSTPVPTSVSNPRTRADGETPTSGGGGSTPAPAPVQAPASSASAPSPNAAPPPPTATGDRDPSPAGEAAPGEPIGAPAPSAAPAPAGGDGAQPEPTPAGEAAGTPGRPPGTDGAAGTADPARDGVMAGTHAPRPADEAAGPVSADDDLPAAVLLLGLSGVAAMALVGSALMVLARRRRAAEAPDATVTADAPMISRRAKRLARAATLDDDPILASLGIGRTRSTDSSRPKRTKSKGGS